MPRTTSPRNRAMGRARIGFGALFVAVVMTATATVAVAHPTGPAKPAASSQPTYDPAAAEVVDAFHAALERGDTTAAAEYLSDALVVFEEGEAERSKAEYAGHHLPADAMFAKAVGSHMTRRSGGFGGDLAWVASEGRTQGRYMDRDIDRITTETMVLRRVSGAWKIVHVHWSSRLAKPKP